MIKHRFDDPLRAIYKDVIQPMIGMFFEVDAIFSMNKQDDSNEQEESKEKVCSNNGILVLFSDDLCAFECDGCGERIISLGDFNRKTRISIAILVKREE